MKFSFSDRSSRNLVHAEDEQRFSKANEIRAFYSFGTRQSNEPVLLLTYFFLILLLKRYDKQLIKPHACEKILYRTFCTDKFQ